MKNKFLGTGEHGYSPLRKVITAISSLRSAVVSDFSVGFQVFNGINSRNETDSVLNRSLFDNRMLWLAIVGVITLQVVVVTWKPAQTFFHTITLSPADWGLAVVLSASVLLLEEVRKWIVRLQDVRT